MKRLLRGSVVLAVAVGFVSCSGDPTSDLREPAGIVASPTTLFIDAGETKPVTASLIDEQGNQIAAEYTITDVGPGITVVQDTAFQHTTAPGVKIDNQVLFQVTAGGIANSSFKLNAGGKSLVVPVRVTPATVEIGISNPTPVWGESITLTAPAGVLFTDSSAVTFGGGPAGQVVGISDDRTMLTVTPGPNTAGAVTISHTTVDYDPTLDFTITSAGTVTSPPLTDLTGAVISNPTPALGEVVTLTLPAGVEVLGDSVLADSGFVVEGATNPADIAVSPDGRTLTFVPAPNSDSVITLRGVVPSVLPQFPQILSTPFKVTTPSIDSIAVVFSNVAPDVLEEITVTAPAGFTFDPTVQFLFGGLPAIIGSLAPDGKSATITPLPGAAGVASITGVIVDAAPQFLLTLPSTTAVTVPAVTPLEGTETPETAPTIALPGVGGSTTINDAGTYDYVAPLFGTTFPARLYKVVVPAPTALTVTISWPTDQDLGVYYFEADGVTEPGEGLPADAGGAGATPETSTSALLAKTYILAVVNFGVGDPPVFSLTISR